MSKDKTIKAAAFRIYGSEEIRYIPVNDIKQIGDFNAFAILYTKAGEEIKVSNGIQYLLDNCGFTLIQP